MRSLLRRKKSRNLELLLFVLLSGLCLFTFILFNKEQQRFYQTRAAAQTDLQSTQFLFTIYLDGIGATGDRTNPVNTLNSGNYPANHATRDVTITVFDTNNQLVLSKTDSIDYVIASENYQGDIDMGKTLTTGNYIIKVKIPGYLRKRVPGIVHVVPLTEVTIPEVTLVAGDLNGDNVINVIDYNILMGCYSDLYPAQFCDDDRKSLADLNADWEVNQLDYNLFMREIAVQTIGD